MADLTMNTEDMELVALELMCKGEDLLAHGVWGPVVKRLAIKELAVKIGNGYRITDKGRAFFAKAEGLDADEVAALAPEMPEWIVHIVDGMLVALHRNEMAVSGYEAMRPARFEPIVHGRMYDANSAFLSGERVDTFLQAVLDLAWARGLRPSDAADEPT